MSQRCPAISGRGEKDHVSLAVNAFALSLSKPKLKKQTNGRYGDEILALSTVPHLCPYLYKQLVSRRFWRDTAGHFTVSLFFSFLFFRSRRVTNTHWTKQSNRYEKTSRIPLLYTWLCYFSNRYNFTILLLSLLKSIKFTQKFYI